MGLNRLQTLQRSIDHKGKGLITLFSANNWDSPQPKDKGLHVPHQACPRLTKDLQGPTKETSCTLYA